MRILLITSCIGIFFVVGCNQKDIVQSTDGNAVLCELNGYTFNAIQTEDEKETKLVTSYKVITERIVIYCDGRYIWEKPQDVERKKEISVQEGQVPPDIFLLLKKSAASNKFTSVNGIRTYMYDFCNSISPHPKGVGELLGHIYQNQTTIQGRDIPY